MDLSSPIRVPALATLFLLVLSSAPGPPLSAQNGGEAPPLYDGLGDHHMEVTTDASRAQRYFDQGLRLHYAFNHAEAIESFRHAAELDRECAMCLWGVALSHGPNINSAMDSASGATAYRAARRARELAEGEADVTPRERAYIDAVVARYGPEPTENRAARDSAYAEAMAEVAERFPADDDAHTLRAEALMLLSPWDYWTDEGELRSHMRAAVRGLETVMERNREHAGACHFFIHTVESAEPERALPCAERIDDLMPAAGHIVHMPGHVYIRVGRYNDAIETNHHAAHADREMIDDMAPDGEYRIAYVPHNHHFLWFAAEMAGRSAEAVEAARQTAGGVDPELMDQPGLAALQHYLVTPLFAFVRFGRWEEILGEPRPAGLPYPTGIWRYARALAHAARDEPARAEEELAALERIRRAEAERLEDEMIWGINSAASVLEIAATVVKGELAAARGDPGAAVRHLERGVALEDDLLYDEPPTWHLPVRHRLGAALLEAGRPAEAEAVYRKSLERFPENGWSLRGLARALRAQGRSDEAAAVDERFRKAWAKADVMLEDSVF